MNLYGLILASVVFLGYFLAKKRSKLYKFPLDHLDNLFFLSVPLAIVGARIYHVVDKWSFYAQNPKQIFLIWQGGLGIFGAIILGFAGIATYYFLVKKDFSLAFFLDLIAPSLLLGQALGRLGNFFNQEAFGPPTNLPWGIYIDQNKRPAEWQSLERFHPTFFYELIWDLVGAAVLFFLAKKLKDKPGAILSLYLIIYGLGRFWVEIFRFDTFQIGQFKIAQMLSLVFIIAGTILAKKIF